MSFENWPKKLLQRVGTCGIRVINCGEKWVTVVIMFHGEYPYSIDLKGRVPVPPRFREELKEGVVLSQGIDKCITVYPVSEWEKIAAKLAALSITQLNSRRLKRRTSSRTYSLSLDGQGRVMVPPLLREYIGIKNEVTIVGNINCLEIWARDAWEAEKAVTDEQFVEIAETVKMPE
ncbi:MAG: division/cell wall cluster transcriptional repressor MraZ [Dehalococcoidia bacterium]|nr:division/cell wall cluster transcriptional repressor MraZ [Dehalococcoidia bacterium]